MTMKTHNESTLVDSLCDST